jgi:hypothetical protein
MWSFMEIVDSFDSSESSKGDIFFKISFIHKVGRYEDSLKVEKSVIIAGKIH